MCTRPAVLLAFLFVFFGIFVAGSPAAPVPPQIYSAKTVFISNAGGATDPYTGRYGDFSGSPDRAYDEFYDAMKTWPRYSLVSAPADADLIFEISFTEFPVPGDVTKTGSGPAVADAKFRLVILDPKTHVTLWTFTEYVGGALLEGNRDKNFDQALGRIVADIQSLAATAPPSPAKN
jgi:hypothetical protein